MKFDPLDPMGLMKKRNSSAEINFDSYTNRDMLLVAHRDLHKCGAPPREFSPFRLYPVLKAPAGYYGTLGFYHRDRKGNQWYFTNRGYFICNLPLGICSCRKTQNNGLALCLYTSAMSDIPFRAGIEFMGMSWWGMCSSLFYCNEDVQLSGSTPEEMGIDFIRRNRLERYCCEQSGNQVSADFISSLAITEAKQGVSPLRDSDLSLLGLFDVVYKA